MAVYIRKYKNTYRPYFYGDFIVRKKRYEVKLCKIEGAPPKSLLAADVGDVEYERSKQKARDMLDEHIANSKGKQDQSSLLRQAAALQSGHDDMEIRIPDLVGLNANRRRFKAPTEKEMGKQSKVLRDFADFATEHGKEFLWEVDEDLADEYCKSLQETYSMKSVCQSIYTLSGAFQRFAPTGLRNPFRQITECLKEGKKEFPSTPHRPLTEAEVDKLVTYAKSDELLYPIVMCCLHAGLRLGDAATLRFSEIHWTTKTIHRKLLKTRNTVNIPIVPPLEKLFREAEAKRKKGQEYIFPKAAAMYSPNDPKLCVLGKRLFAMALFGEEEPKEPPRQDEEQLSPIEMMRLIAEREYSKSKTDRLNDEYSRYISGQSYRQIEQEAGYSRGQISEDLRTLEAISGKRIRPPKKTYRLKDLIAKTQEVGTSGKNKRSIYGWHSLRATHVVLALLKYGHPLELLRKYCGHTTVDTTLLYFDPTEEHIHEMLTSPNKTSFFTGWSAPTPTPSIDQPTLEDIGRYLAALSKDQRALLKAML